MKKITAQLPVKYCLLILCCFFICSNSFAVKPVNNSKQNVETVHIEAEKKISLKERIYMKILQRAIKKNSNEMLDESTTSVEELIVYLKLNNKVDKRFIEGDRLKVRTKEKVLHKGELEIIDADHISINEKVIAVEDILSIEKGRLFNIVLGTLGLIITAITFIEVINSDGEDSGVEGTVFSILLFSALLIFSLLLLFANKKYFHKQYRFSTSKNVSNSKQNVETVHIDSNEKLGDSMTPVEELIVYLKSNDKEVRRFKEGYSLKVRTKEKVFHKGELKIIDADHISISEETIAVEDILSIHIITTNKYFHKRYRFSTTKKEED